MYTKQTEKVHYYYTPKELNSLHNKGPGCFQNDQALCNNGSFHFKRSKLKELVTCEVCRKRLGLV